MLKGSRQESLPDKIVTLIGPDTYLSGTIKAKGLVRIDGVMEGELETEGDVIVGADGRATLDIRARNIAVAGYFKGNLDITGKLEIKETGTVAGNIKVKGLVIDEGAHFTGNCEMKDSDAGAIPAATGRVDRKKENKQGKVD